MKKIVILGMVLALSYGAAADAALITEWNFNGASATTVPGGSLSPTPSTGAGTASLVGGATAAASFSSGTANGGSSDPVATTPTNFGWQTTTYPAQSTGDKTGGTQYAVSTAGWKDIMVEWDLRHSNTSSRFEQFQYSTDGTTFVDFGAAFSGPAGDTWFNNRAIDLSTIPGANNNADFAFRVVSTFGPAGAYVASNTASSYATTGTWRFDMVQVSGVEVPEPVSWALGLLGVVASMAVSRRR